MEYLIGFAIGLFVGGALARLYAQRLINRARAASLEALERAESLFR